MSSASAWRCTRSEERRVGKECRSRWSPDHEKKKGAALLYAKRVLENKRGANHDQQVGIEIVELLSIAEVMLGEAKRESVVFFFQAEDGIRGGRVTGVQTCALPICLWQIQPIRHRQARMVIGQR